MWHIKRVKSTFARYGFACSNTLLSACRAGVLNWNGHSNDDARVRCQGLRLPAKYTKALRGSVCVQSHEARERQKTQLCTSSLWACSQGSTHRLAASLQLQVQVELVWKLRRWGWIPGDVCRREHLAGVSESPRSSQLSPLPTSPRSPGPQK